MSAKPSRTNVILLVGALLLVWFSGCQQRTNGALDAQLKGRKANIEALQKYIAITDKQYHVKKTVATKTVGSWRKLTASLQAPDSLAAPDTFVPLTPRETLIIAAGDTAINSCVAVVASCELRVAQRDAMIDTLNAQIKTALKKSSGKVTYTTAAILSVVGYIVGRTF